MCCDCSHASVNTENERRTLRVAFVERHHVRCRHGGRPLGSVKRFDGGCTGHGHRRDCVWTRAHGGDTGSAIQAVLGPLDRCDAHAPSAGNVADVTRRFLFGSDPLGAAMVGFSLLSLFVNVTVLRMLAQYRARRSPYAS
jgi:hypothetical protein